MTDDVSIRRATSEDLPRMLDLDPVKQRAGDLERAVAGRNARVALVSGRIVGFSVAGIFFGHDFLELLLVDPPYRRHGVGTALVLDWEYAARAPKLFTSTNESNESMQRLCEAMGFVRSGVIQNLDEGDPEIVYFKPAPER